MNKEHKEHKKKDYTKGASWNSRLKPEMVKCLRCHKQFRSWNKRYNRICPKCKESKDFE